VFGGPRLVAETGLPSREVAAPCGVFDLKPLASSLVRRSPSALHRFRLGSRVFTPQAPKRNRLLSGSSHGLRLLFRGCPSTEPLHRDLGFPKSRRPDFAVRHSAAPPVRFRPLQRFPARSSGMLVGPSSPDRLRLQVFSTSWRLHPPRACRPCFMPDPLLGPPFRALFLSHSRTPSSGAVPLMAFNPPSGFFSV
jgi:hypothetical protein